SVCQYCFVLLSVPSQKFFEDGDHPRGYVVDRQLLVAGSQGTALLVPAHYLLDSTPAPVGHPVKGLVARLVLPGRDHRAEVATPQPHPDAGVAVALVRADTPGPAAPARATGT